MFLTGEARSQEKTATSPAKTTYALVKGGKSRVTFFGSTAFGGVEGKTTALRGWIHLSPESLADGGTLSLDALLDSLDTGVGLRNQHARDHLETQKFPTASLKASTLTFEKAALADGESSPVTLSGTMTIHGVSKPITLQGTIRRDGAALRAKASFKVRFTDFGMAQPSFMLVSVSDEISMTVDLFFTATGAPDAAG